VASAAIQVELIEKLFPPAQTGWRAFLSPFVRHTHRALAPISFHVAPGESLAIVGANGAGKSTLLRILTTLLLPTSGRAEVAGFDVIRQPETVRHSLGFHSGAEPGFYARLTALQNLEFFAQLRDLSPQEAKLRIAEVSEGLGLSPSLNRQVRLLSSGTVQRLSLARAVLHRPQVLLLDEPTRSLDPLAAAEFRRYLRDDLIRRHGATLLFASHTLAEVEELADRVALLDLGRLLFCGTPAEMRAAASAVTLEDAMIRLTRGADAETGASPL
jgi:sodium transport system ATP-binding protein